MHTRIEQFYTIVCFLVSRRDDFDNPIRGVIAFFFIKLVLSQIMKIYGSTMYHLHTKNSNGADRNSCVILWCHLFLIRKRLIRTDLFVKNEEGLCDINFDISLLKFLVK